MMRRFFPSTIRQVGVGNSLFPDQVDNLSIWYDVSDTQTITKDPTTGAVSQIDDKSVNAKHLTQDTGGMQPIWTENQFKGFDVIRFTAGNSHHLINLTETIQANDIFAVIKPLQSGPNGGIMYSSFQSDSSVVYFETDWRLAETFLRTNFRSGTSFLLNDNIIIDVDGGTIINNYHTTQISHINTSQKTDDIFTAVNSPDARSFALGRLRILSSPVYGSFDFLELFAYSSAVSDNDREKLWQYLSDKYSLTKPTL